MAIPEEFKAKYADEAEFTNGFLVPLLSRLGFALVANYHSAQEFGKDIVFAEVDAFGHVRYHGLQAKYVGSVSQSDAHGLVEDAMEAFTHPFKHPHTGAEEYVDSFYAVNGGSIAPNAREHFFASLRVPHGGRVRMLDGNALLQLDRLGTVRTTTAWADTLSGLRMECRLNLAMNSLLKKGLDRTAGEVTPPPVYRYRVNAMEAFLAKPFLSQYLDWDETLHLANVCEIKNRTLDSLGGPMRGEDRIRHAASLAADCAEMERLFLDWLKRIDATMSQVAPITPI